jgi:pyruvate formate lyase activating enzyme
MYPFEQCGGPPECHNPDTWTLTNGMPVSVAKAAQQLGKYRHGLKTMAGGFTLSGGEPLMQDRFAAKLLSAAKKMGIQTTIETNGLYTAHGCPTPSWTRSIS